MDITISGRHVAVTDAMRDHARQRAERLTRMEHIQGVRITLAIEGDRKLAEVIVSVRAHGELVAKSETHDMYASIDEAVAKCEKQLQKIEERFRTRREAARRMRTPEGEEAPTEEEKPEATASPEDAE